MLRLRLLPLLLLSTCYPSQPMMRPYEVSVPNPGIVTDLKVRAKSAASVMATLTLTNTTNDTVWLYKPILCEGAWEDSYAVMQVNKTDLLDFLPTQTEEHVKAYPETLITGVVPRLADSLYVKLAPAQTYVVQTNLSEAFDFTGRHGEYWAIYIGQMPLMNDGKQVHMLDPTYPKVGPLPAYFSLNSSANMPVPAVKDRYLSHLYVPFILP